MHVKPSGFRELGHPQIQLRTLNSADADGMSVGGQERRIRDVLVRSALAPSSGCPPGLQLGGGMGYR